MNIQLMTIDEVASLLRLHPKSIYRFIQREGFPRPVKIGAASRWDLAAVQNWINSRSKA